MHEKVPGGVVESRYAQQRAAGFRWLRFVPELEREYATSLVNRFGARAGIAAALGLAAAAIFMVLARRSGSGAGRDWMGIYVGAVTGAVAYYFMAHAARAEFLLRSELRQQALLDGLTGLMNRRAFESHVESVWLQAQRTLTAIGLMLIDLDDFEKINDRCGHPFADNALQHIGQVLRRSAMRPMDAAARYGGDQFIALWFEVDGGWLAKLAEDMPVRLDGLGCGEAGARLKVTVSGGAVLAWPRPGMTVHDAIRAAEEVMREMKEEQRGAIGYRVLRPAPLPQEKSAA